MSATKRCRTSPVATTFMDLPTDVIRTIQTLTYDATTRLRLQAVIPKVMWARRESDSALSLIEYCSKRGMVVENAFIMEFLFARTERSAREILESMVSYPGFVRRKNLMADIDAEQLRDPSDLPNARDIEDDFYIAYDAIFALGHKSVAYFYRFVETDMFAQMKRKFVLGGRTLYRRICAAKNEPLFDHVQNLARDDPWFHPREKDLETQLFESKMSGNPDSAVPELFKSAVSQMNMPVARTLFERLSKIQSN